MTVGMCHLQDCFPVMLKTILGSTLNVGRNVNFGVLMHNKLNVIETAFSIARVREHTSTCKKLCFSILACREPQNGKVQLHFVIVKGSCICKIISKNSY